MGTLRSNGKKQGAVLVQDEKHFTPTSVATVPAKATDAKAIADYVKKNGKETIAPINPFAKKTVAKSSASTSTFVNIDADQVNYSASYVDDGKGNSSIVITCPFTRNGKLATALREDGSIATYGEGNQIIVSSVVNNRFGAGDKLKLNGTESSGIALKLQLSVTAKVLREMGLLTE